MLNQEDVIQRNNVKVYGSAEPVLLFAHGFGCNQQMWRFLLPKFIEQYRIVLFDYVGSGASNLAAYSKQKYGNLEGYANDIVDIISALDLQQVILVGHSVSSIIGLIAAQKMPERIQSLVMICPSPCFLNIPPDYFGGFNQEDLQELIDLMDKNYIGWAQYLAPLVTGMATQDPLTTELSTSFCTTNPVTAKVFAKATFFSDYRALLPQNKHPALLIQSDEDALASVYIGDYMQQQMPQSVLAVISAKGHCLHMTHPDEVAATMHNFLATCKTTSAL